MVRLVVLSGAAWVASWAVMSGKGLNPILLAAFGSWTSVGAPGQRPSSPLGCCNSSTAIEIGSGLWAGWGAPAIVHGLFGS